MVTQVNWASSLKGDDLCGLLVFVSPVSNLWYVYSVYSVFVTYL